MRVAVFGSTDWEDYPDLMRQITVFIQEVSELGHDKLTFVHTGRRGAENMITEYIGKTEKFLNRSHFRLREQLFIDRTNLSDVNLIESGIEYALVFSTKDKRTNKAMSLLTAYDIPFRVME